MRIDRLVGTDDLHRDPAMRPGEHPEVSQHGLNAKTRPTCRGSKGLTLGQRVMDTPCGDRVRGVLARFDKQDVQ